MAKRAIAPTLGKYLRLNAKGPHMFAGDEEHYGEMLREFNALKALARAANEAWESFPQTNLADLGAALRRLDRVSGGKP